MKNDTSSEKNKTCPVAPRSCLIVASVLAAFGVLRFLSDVLTDAVPGWHAFLDGMFLRYLARAPSDGTFLGDLSVQWVKLLAVPCGISGIFLVHLLLYDDRNAADAKWRRPEIRALYLLALLVAFTLMEIEKATHFFGLKMAGLLPGERAWLNHVLHLISLLIGWLYMRWLRFVPTSRPQQGDSRCRKTIP